jgi:hypothetical protein
LMSIALAALALIAINLLVATSLAQGRTASTLINCSGSIQACIDAANDGDTILIAAGTYTESLTLSKPVSLTGENRDTTIIHAVEGQRVLTVTGATIDNSVVISGLTFTGGSAIAGSGSCLELCGGGILVDDNAQPLLSNIIVTDNSAQLAGGVYAKVLKLKDSRIENNIGGGAVAYTATIVGGEFNGNADGGGVAAEVLALADTHFISNTAYEGGGAYVNQSATIVNALFENNRCTGDYCGGGGIYLTQYFAGSLTLSKTTFINNLAYNGGAVSSHRPVSVKNSAFISNSARSTGGGIWVQDSPLDMENTYLNSNTAQDGGGGAMILGIATITGSHFEGNVSNGNSYAGGIYAYKLQLTNTVFISNSSKHAGGAQAPYAYINGGRFERNTSTGWGGGLAVNNLFMTGTIVISNTAGGGGGAWVPGITWLNGVRFENNRALGDEPAWSNGGGLLAEFDSLFISGTYFINNSAVTYGGGLSFNSDVPGYVVNTVFAGNHSDSGRATVATTAGGDLDLLHTTIADSTLNPQPAIAVLSGTLHLTDTIIANHAIGISNTGGIVNEDYNLFFNTVTNTIGVTSGGHSLIGDPKFVDPLNGDYHLQFGSAAIDHGVDTGVTTDLDGNPRPHGVGFDIGAYEYQSGHYLWLPLIRK